MIHPLHPHHLEQVDPVVIYPTYNGHWRCDNCHRESGPLFGRPYHCNICSYDLCQTCINSERTLAHEHLLFYVNTSQLFYQQSNGMWKCDACQRTSTDLGQSCSYHCEICSFDLCRGCYEQKDHPVHCHPIRKADTRLVYTSTGGNWVCDVCCNTSRPYERFAYHCAECDFDVCDNCFSEHQTPFHAHPVVKADSLFIYRQFNGGWKCDKCGSIHRTSEERWPWHCRRCEYDICDRCMHSNPSSSFAPGGMDVAAPPRRLVPLGQRGFSGLFPRPPVENPWSIRAELNAPGPTSPEDSPSIPENFKSERGNAVTCPDESKEEIKKKDDAKENTDDGDECIICLEMPKNATVIHGDTGHCCCCWACAQVLKRRGDPCPICRAHIDHVIRQFNS